MSPWDKYMPHELKECDDYWYFIMAYNFCQFVHLAKVVNFFSWKHMVCIEPEPSPPPFSLENFTKLQRFVTIVEVFFVMQGRFGNNFFLGEFFPFSFFQRNFVRKNMFYNVKCFFLAKIQHLSENFIPKWTIEIGN